MRVNRIMGWIEERIDLSGARHLLQGEGGPGSTTTLCGTTLGG